MQTLKQAWWAPLVAVFVVAELLVAQAFLIGDGTSNVLNAESTAAGSMLALGGAAALVAGLWARPKSRGSGNVHCRRRSTVSHLGLDRHHDPHRSRGHRWGRAQPGAFNYARDPLAVLTSYAIRSDSRLSATPRSPTPTRLSCAVGGA